MVKVAWKTIKGYGPYAYLQESVRIHGKVVSKHLAYLGKIGGAPPALSSGGSVTPGRSIKAAGYRAFVPPVDLDTQSHLKAKPLGKLKVHRMATAAGIPGPAPKGTKKELGATPLIGKGAIPTLLSFLTTKGNGEHGCRDIARKGSNWG
jgi:hypothetical protein